MRNRRAVLDEPIHVGVSEDWTATLVGLSLLALVLMACLASQPADVDWHSAQIRAAHLREHESRVKPDDPEMTDEQRADLAKLRKKSSLEKLGIEWNAPARQWLAKINSWRQNPLDAFRPAKKPPGALAQWFPLIFTFIVVGMIGLAATMLRGKRPLDFLKAFPALFLLSVLAYLMSAQEVIKYYNFEYPLWGLFVGMLIGNTIGTPGWMRPAAQGELFIKIGLVLLGAEVLLSRLMALGVPGVFVAWVVTPIVLIGTYAFGQRILKISSRSLNMVISADMSVCGVSAAIATAAACKAKKEELSLAIGLSLTFTAVMMVVMPMIVLWMDLDPVIGGAWIGGTIDSTGAVVAAGEALGVVGSETAVTVKMIQNILIGFTALGVALYWSRWVEPSQFASNPLQPSKSEISWIEIWIRFPKFVIGFGAASLVCSLILWYSFFGESLIQTATVQWTAPVRGWLFCLAFVSIGLSTNFRELAPYLRSGKPLVLYACGQLFNLILTLVMAYLMFGIIFRTQGL